MKHRVLVTGGAGFIGSHLCRRLLADGNEVICLDNLLSGARANIEELIPNPDFTFVEADVTEPYDFDVDQIYNLACPASPVHYQRDPIKTAMTNVLGALHALELATRTPKSKLFGDPAPPGLKNSRLHREFRWRHRVRALSSYIEKTFPIEEMRKVVERVTRLELATSTLARWRSTR